jgi:uncharacterized protein with ParB-like and HNH nuclease domain
MDRHYLMKKIEGLFTIQEIFEGRLFRIPDYQRGYAWKEEQVNALWEDILNILDGNTQIHYTGVVIVQQLTEYDVKKWLPEFDGHIVNYKNGILNFNNSLELKPLYLADGQQRLTTIMLLLTCLTEHKSLLSRKEATENFFYKQIGGKYIPIFGYEFHSPAYNFFLHTVLNLVDEGYTYNETSYTSNIKKAKEFLKQKIAGWESTQIHRVYFHILHSLRFNFYELPVELNIFTVFETMNYRGKSLSNLELLKNRLIYLVDIALKNDLIRKDLLRKRINDAWSSVYQNLAQNPDRLLNDDEYLRNHWLIYFDHNFNSSEDLARYKQNLLDDRFVKYNIYVFDDNINYISVDDIEKYVNSLELCSSYFFKLKFPSHYKSNLPRSIAYWIEKISKLMPKSYFEPLILAALVKEEPEDIMVNLLSNIERYLFIVFALGGLRSNTNKTPFLIEANKYFGQNKKLDIIIQKLRPEKSFKDPELRSSEPLVKLPNLDDLLDNFFRNRQKDRSDEGYICWKFVKYFMQEYEESLIRLNNNYNSFSSNANYLDLIFPPFKDLPKKDREKTRMFMEYNEQRVLNWNQCIEGFGKDTGQMYLCYTLGNLVLTTKGKDTSPDTFEFKKKYTKDSTFSEREVFLEDNWGPKEILARGIRLLIFLEKRWNIQIEYTFKKQLLYLNQLNIPDDHIQVREYQPPSVDLFSEEDDNQPIDDTELDIN